MATMGLSGTVSEINGDFCRKLFFSTPVDVYFAPPLKELGIGAGRQKLE